MKQRKKLSDQNRRGEEPNKLTKSSGNGSVFKSPWDKTYMADILKHLSSPINIFDHRKKKLLYVNDEFVRLAGLTAEECYSQELKDFDSWIHPGDLFMLKSQVRIRLDEVFRKYINDSSIRLTYLINFRLKEKKNNGELISVLSQCSVLEWDDHYSPVVTMNMLSDTTHYSMNQKMILIVNLYDAQKQQWKSILREEFLSVPDILTDREREIMSHILLDKSAIKISEELDMSYHTVRTHWRNILQKTKCKTQKDLKQMALLKGWV